MMPTSGGQYHWVSVLAPDNCKIFLSYVSGETGLVSLFRSSVPDCLGWLSVLGWLGSIAATSFFTGSMTQALIAQMVPDYSPTGWQETLFMWAYLALVLFFNSVLSKALPAIEIGILIIHILGFFAIFISILYLAPKATAADVFTIFNNGGGWPSQGLSFFVGLAGVAAAFIGKCSKFEPLVMHLTLFRCRCCCTCESSLICSHARTLILLDVGRDPPSQYQCSQIHGFFHFLQWHDGPCLDYCFLVQCRHNQRRRG